MCIAVFSWQAHPIYPFLLLLNRDEYHDRPTEALAWWQGGEILGGRDVLGGGTWLACSRDGRLAFLTNVREVLSNPEAESRGNLILRFLESKKKPMDFAEELMKEIDQYNGFNLIVSDICSKSMIYITNRPREDNATVVEVSPGIHVLTNASLDSPWPKAQRLSHGFKELLDKYGDGEIPREEEIVEKLMRNTIKDGDSFLPHIYSPEREHHLSSIFVDTYTPRGRYGTRSTSSLCVRSNGEVNFYETHLEKETWAENTLTYQIQRIK